MIHAIDNVYCVGRSNWGGVTPLSRGTSNCNTWLINGGSEAAIVDTGMPEGLDDLLENIRKAKVDLQRVRKILITHAHWDHIAALPELQKTLDAKVYAHELAKETIAGRQGIYTPTYTPPVKLSAAVDEVVREGDSIRVGNLTLKVIELPGHTPDGVGFCLPLKDGVGCFTGDTAIGDQACAKGVIGWIDASWNSRMTHHKASLERIKAGNFSAMFAGHGDAILGRENVVRSMDNCLWRLGLFMSIPGFETMSPVRM